MRSFFRFFAERHILASLITIMIILLGLSTMMGIKRDIYPHVEFGIMNITTVYPGASPEDVELNVTNKIETELLGVTGIDRVTSISMENVSVIGVFVDINEPDQDEIMSEIREAVARVTDFPAEVTQSPQLTEMKQTMPAIEVGLSGDVPYGELREYARIFDKKLRDIRGISHLDKYGYRAREIRVEVSPDAAAEYQIPLREIIAAIQRRNIRGTSGSFESYTSEKNLVTLAQFRDPLEVGDVVVRSTFDGPLVQVKDLAIMRDDFDEIRVLSRMNGVDAISFVVFVSDAADVIRTTDAVKAMVEQEQGNMPAGISIRYAADTSSIIRNSFDVVLTNGLIGLVLVVLLLTVFLNTRTAFWVAMGIPVSLLGVIFLLPQVGIYLDTITLTGMILVIGIIVDDAIIIAENIAAHRDKGEEPLEAAVNGISEVFSPVLTTVLTTFLVFAPMFFMPGIFGKYVAVIPMAISLALFVSLFEVMVALPAHLVPGLRRKTGTTAGRSWFQALRVKYRRFVERFLRFRYLLLVLFMGVLIGSVGYAGKFMKFIMFPSEMATSFYVLIETPTGTSLKATSETVRKVEELIASIPDQELESYVSRIGTNVMINAESENYAGMTVSLAPYAERERTADEIVEELRQKAEGIEGIADIVFFVNTGGPPIGKPINVKIVGSNDDMRTRLADSVETFLNGQDGVKDVSRDDKAGKEQVEIKIDYLRLSRLGLTVADVAQNVRLAYDGEVVTSVRYGDEDVDFRVLMSRSGRQKLDYLNELKIPNREGRLIPLGDVAALVTGPGASDFRHYNSDRTVTVNADVDQNIITALGANEALTSHFNLDRDWPGMQFLKGGEVVETEESVGGLMRTLLIALVGIYFLLVLLFNSLTQPFLVMIAIPFGISGVIIAFALHGQPMSFTAMMGVIGLSGVVVNDSLVLVSHINTLIKEQGRDNLISLVAEGTSDRLRAVIMTTLTTVVGLLPLAYGLGGTDAFMAPMALALGYGLLFATPLTLVLVPCLFIAGNDLRLGIAKVVPSFGK
ncbi:efflux RND transporter permease subunit [Candidatus Neomarinimicrobiota bacterium]